jgi:electron transport complex protein RnfD
MLENITVSPGPHISKAHSTRSIMLDVIIALTPAILAACWFFRLPAVMVIAVCVISCAVTELICNLIRKRSNSLDDLSAVVTGIILALSLPAAIPLWAAAIGSILAIAIGKMVFGGLGSNTFNPAMVARTFMAVSLGSLMTTWTLPATIDADMPAIKISAEPNVAAVTQATPLGWSKQAIKGESSIENANSLRMDAMFGSVGGCLGETSSLALIFGGVYMLFRKTITYVIPTAVLGSAALFAAICFFISPEKFADPGFHLISGGMLLCAFFIATDPVTAPITKKGMWVFGIGTGLIIMLIRNIGGYPEGVMFAILLMNALTPLIDRACKITPCGGKKND